MSNPPRNIVETLEAVKELLRDPEHWVKHHYAITEKPHGEGEAKEVAWCLVGALRHVDSPYMVSAVRALHEARPKRYAFVSLESYNDDEKTTHNSIIRTLNRAIRREKCGVGGATRTKV